MSKKKQALQPTNLRTDPVGLLGIESLTKDDIRAYLDLAKKIKGAMGPQASVGDGFGKATASLQKYQLLNHTVVSLFYEASTRTRSSFEMAAKNLKAEFIHLNADSSTSVSKGETLVDTARNLEAMNPDFLVLRHAHSGAPQFLAQRMGIPIINAGDGFHEHPTQALLDAFTMEERFQELKGLRVTIVGDIAHSRVARSNIHLLQKLGAKVTVCGPPTLIPPEMEKFGVAVSYRISEAVQRADVVMMLRVQAERQDQKQFPSAEEYFNCFGLHRGSTKFLPSHAIIMHPGPVNRGVEISSDVADGKNSVILNQVSNGVAVRMAVLVQIAQMNRQKNYLKSSEKNRDRMRGET